MSLRIGVSRRKAVPKLFRRDEAGPDNFAPAPDQPTHPKHLAVPKSLRSLAIVSLHTGALVKMNNDQ